MSVTSLWLLRSTARMSASHPKATESLRSSEMTLSANCGPRRQRSNYFSGMTREVRIAAGGTPRPRGAQLQ
jgi:hypothetical protein